MFLEPAAERSASDRVHVLGPAMIQFSLLVCWQIWLPATVLCARLSSGLNSEYWKWLLFTLWLKTNLNTESTKSSVSAGRQGETSLCFSERRPDSALLLHSWSLNLTHMEFPGACKVLRFHLIHERRSAKNKAEKGKKTKQGIWDCLDEERRPAEPTWL